MIMSGHRRTTIDARALSVDPKSFVQTRTCMSGRERTADEDGSTSDMHSERENRRTRNK